MPRQQPVVSVPGLARLSRELRAIDGRLVDKLKEVNHRVGELVVTEARRRAPRGPDKGGHIADTLRATRAAGRVSILAGGARQPYGGPIHFGWPAHHIEGDPFVWDAAKATEPDWTHQYELGLGEVLDTVAGNY